MAPSVRRVGPAPRRGLGDADEEGDQAEGEPDGAGTSRRPGWPSCTCGTGER